MRQYPPYRAQSEAPGMHGDCGYPMVLIDWLRRVGWRKAIKGSLTCVGRESDGGMVSAEQHVAQEG